MTNALVCIDAPPKPDPFQPLHFAHVGDQRQASRTPAWIRNVQISHQGISHPGKLIDVSENGCLIASDHPYERGERIWLHIDGSPACLVEVRWVRDGQAGCMFDPEYDTSFLRRATLPQF